MGALRQLTLTRPSEIAVIERNRIEISGSRLGMIAAMIELQRDAAEDRGEAEQFCEDCAAQSPRCAEVGCARRIIEYVRGGTD